jgi:glycosyltransferase involved in cell wall biosynthesis
MNFTKKSSKLRMKLGKIITITGRVHPHTCGVGDYSVNLAAYCQNQLGVTIDIVVEQGCQESDNPVKVFSTVESWYKLGWQQLLEWLKSENVETVILQYTPWLYSDKGYNLALLDFWQQCHKSFETLLIVHETYFWFLKYPGTWMVGLLQQYVLRSLLHSSHHVFCASEFYLHRLKRFSNSKSKIHYLPIPSNIPFQPLSSSQKQSVRQKLGIAPEQLVITLFGCGESILPNWISALDLYLNSNYSIIWLLLGNAQSLKPLKNPAIRPGYLAPIELSHYLQISNLMLMPHRFGISAKRTSLMSALEHGIPVIGTDGMLTDSFLRQLPSVFLAPENSYPAFEKQVVNSLTQLPNLDNLAKVTQNYYDSNLSWSVVTKTLLPYLQQ